MKDVSYHARKTARARVSTAVAAAVIAAIMALLGRPAHVVARSCQHLDFPDTIDVDGHHLVLNGLGIRESTVFQVNVYVAGLYLERRTRDAHEAIASEQVKRLELRFVRDVERSDVVNAFDEGFRNNAGTERLGLAREIAQLLGWMSDFAVGDTMIYTYVPEQGVTVVVNGETRGTIASAPFARALFSLFIGDHPPNGGLKRGLLGGRCR